MQAVCTDKGADRKPDLYKQINSVVESELREYSDEIRHWGNIGGCRLANLLSAMAAIVESLCKASVNGRRIAEAQ